MKCKASMATVGSPAAEVNYHCLDRGSWIKSDYYSCSSPLMHASLKREVFLSAVGAGARRYKV